jgi:hydrogenase expression/formation protein HypE
VGIALSEQALPIGDEVRGACELLGFDPLYVANEGKLVAIVGSHCAAALIEAMRGHERGRHAAIIGDVVAEHPGIVTMRSLIGGERVVALLGGEQLPRIC